jgi:hypothetical protein
MKARKPKMVVPITRKRKVRQALIDKIAKLALYHRQAK